MSSLKAGKAAQAVMDRSVLRPLRLSGAAAAGLLYGQDAVPALFSGGFAGMARSMGVIGEMSWRNCENLILEAASRLAGTFIKADLLQLGFVLPEACSEEQLRAWIDEIAACCVKYDLKVAGADVQVCPDVAAPVLSITAAGSRAFRQKSGQTMDNTRVSPAQETDGTQEAKTDPGADSLVMAGTAGSGGASVLARTFETVLRARLPAELLQAAQSFGEQARLLDIADVAAEQGAARMYAAGEGGLFGALWEMCELLGCGLEADLRSIPIRQETVEICEILDVNPYTLYSQGAALILTSDPATLIKTLRENGIPAAEIGRVTGGRARILKNGEETRYLDKASQDELVRIWKTYREAGADAFCKSAGKGYELCGNRY